MGCICPLFSFPRRPSPAAIELGAFRRQPGVPFEAFPFLFERFAGGDHPVVVPTRKPSGINLVGNGITKVGIVLILRSFR
jgi:hypothetical protein